MIEILANLYCDVTLESKTLKDKLLKLRRFQDIVEHTCSLASGDQCSAKGNISDSVAAEDNSSSSLLVITCTFTNFVSL